MSKHNLCGGLCWVTRANSLCVSVFSFLYPINEREREERFPFRKSVGDKGDALNAESLQRANFGIYSTQGKFLVSLNPSNCSLARCWYKSMTVTQQMNKFKLAFGTIGVGAKERDGLYLRIFQSIWGQKFWQKQETKQHFEAETLGLSPWVFVSGSDIHLLWDLGQVLFSSRLWFPGLKSQRVKTRGIWAPSSLNL